MSEPNVTFYEINTLDIWDFERAFYFSDRSSGKRVETVVEKLENLIIKCYNNKVLDANGRPIDSITDLKKIDSGEHGTEYYSRYASNWNSAIKDRNERIAISIFPLKDGFYSLHQNINISLTEEKFDFWFMLKLSQYDFDLKYLENFLNYQLTHNFQGDTIRFIKFLKMIVLQFEQDYLTTRQVFLINNWIKDHSVKTESEQSVNSNDELIHKTFLLDLVNDQPGIIKNPKNKATMELMEGFLKLKKERLLFGDVNWEEFKTIFQRQALKDKIKWEGSMIELKWFVQQICKPGLCSHLERGLEKWKVAQECFLVRRKNGWVEINSYKQISNANGSRRRLPAIEKFGEKLLSLKI